MPEDPITWLLGDKAQGFMTDVYEQAPIIVHHGDSDRFKPLLTIAAVDRIIAERDLREGMLVMANAAR
ncbi:MAG: hypothetical protein WCI21_06980, partial [Alphaproteobacteria bacterium]